MTELYIILTLAVILFVCLCISVARYYDQDEIEYPEYKLKEGTDNWTSAGYVHSKHKLDQYRRH